jgi:pimeloyl-ACP methyl ester carboxylesterase
VNRLHIGVKSHRGIWTRKWINRRANQPTQPIYGSLAQVTQISGNAGGPVETLLLANCGHQPHLEQCQAVLARVTEFLLNRP